MMAPAKLNLMLHIVGRRTDGYHLLQTVFQLLDYGDQLQFELRGDSAIHLDSELAGVNTPDNLVYRAARLLQQTSGTALGAAIAINKVLPMGGGLGGGSSNAATALLALNQLWQTGFSLDQLAALGQQLGADVPVFVRGRSAWGEGIGEKLQAIDIAESWYLVIKPDCHISTPQIFSHKQLTRNTPPITIAAFFGQGGHNDCEPVVRRLYPEVDKALIWLTKEAPQSTPQLTGTGACVFARFADEQSARQLLNGLPNEFWGFVAKGVNHSPAHQALNL